MSWFSDMRTGVALVCTLAVSISPSLAADLQQQMRACSRIQDSIKRIACFDALVADSAPTLQPTPSATERPSGSGQWNVTTKVSKIDDSTNVYLLLESIEPIRGRFGENAPMTLSVVCRENKTALYFRFAGQFMSSLEGGGVITYRVDKRPAQTKAFLESNNHEALGLWGVSEAIPFIKGLFGAERLFVRAIPYNESAVSGEFVVGGLENAIKPLRQACGWHGEANVGTDRGQSSAADHGIQYVVQVGSKLTQMEAMTTFVDMAGVYPTLLAPYRPIVQKEDLGAKGIWYRLRIGPIEDKRTAIKLCGQLKARGHPDCLVLAAQ